MNNTVFEYFRKYRGKYPLEALKKKALAAGYPAKDVDDAVIMSAQVEDSAPKKQKETKPTTPTKQRPKKSTTTSPTTSQNTPINKKKFGLMMIGGILGLLFFLIYLGLITAGVYFEVDLLHFFNVWWVLGITIISYIYLLGFIQLARATQSKLLLWTTYARMALALGFVGLYALIRPTLLNNSTNFESITMGLIFAYTIIWVTTKTLFAIGLIKQRENITFLQVVGILHIIYLSLITLGFLYTIYLFFNEGTFNLDPTTMTILYWDFVIIEIFVISSLFFEAIALFFAHKKYE